MKKIILTSISKNFKIGFDKRKSVLERFLSIFSGQESKRNITILKDISLEINAGEILGVIGKNGSGKSTLLRIIAGIYKPDAGTVEVHGKVISIINLGVGLKERLTMRDNIFLVGSLFGMSKKQIQNKFDTIVDFSELSDFVSTKIYQFSAGMIQRLSFSIAIHSNPDILLLDEVFEVGDDSFRKKSSEKIKQLAQSGASVVLISHDVDLIHRNCTRVIKIQDDQIELV